MLITGLVQPALLSAVSIATHCDGLSRPMTSGLELIADSTIDDRSA